ncbi:hypothetical protein ScPMuIL_006678, partial [Solemya velum]
ILYGMQHPGFAQDIVTDSPETFTGSRTTCKTASSWRQFDSPAPSTTTLLVSGTQGMASTA